MKLFAWVSYLGTYYHGFQKQKYDENTIQGVLEKTLKILFPDGFSLKAAGRTDKGVHAKKQAITFLIHHEVDPHKIEEAWNKLLPDDIAVSSLHYVPDSFDARHSAYQKVYVYRFRLGEKDPLSPTVAFFPKEGFSFSSLSHALSLYLGKHNFQNFNSKSEDLDGFCRDIKKCSLKEVSENEYEAIFVGNGFMRRQVRMMMGVAFEIAYQRKEENFLLDLLTSPTRKVTKFVAPSRGLTLEDVIYE